MQIEIGIEIVAIAALILSTLGFIVDVFIYKVKTAGISPALILNLREIRVFTNKKGNALFEIVNKGGGRADFDYLTLRIDIIEYPMTIELEFDNIEPMETQMQPIKIPPLPSGTHELEIELGYHSGILRKHDSYRKYAIEVESSPTAIF